MENNTDLLLIKKAQKDKEKIVNKNNASFVKSLLYYLNYDFNYREYKKLVMGERMQKNNTDFFLKDTYDAYLYLLNNSQSKFILPVMKKFCYILIGEEVDDSILKKIQTKYFLEAKKDFITRITDFHFYIYEVFKNYNEKIQIIIAMCVINACLISYDFVPLKLTTHMYTIYEKIKQEYFYGNKNKAYKFILDMISNTEMQSKDYYKNLTPLNLENIVKKILNEKEVINNVFKIKSMSISGSFVNHNFRIDSDIDLLVTYKEDISYEEKYNVRNMLISFLTQKFQRYVDIIEINENLNTDFILNFNNIRKIF